jgi:hypothetical protein
MHRQMGRKEREHRRIDGARGSPVEGPAKGTAAVAWRDLQGRRKAEARRECVGWQGCMDRQEKQEPETDERTVEERRIGGRCGLRRINDLGLQVRTRGEAAAVAGRRQLVRVVGRPGTEHAVR